MKTLRRIIPVCVVSLLLAATACSFSVSTANLSSLYLGKDKEVSQQVAVFASTDVVYAAADVSNAPGPVKLKGILSVDKIEGQEPGMKIVDTSLDLAASGRATFNFNPPTAGWPKGSYKIEVQMLDSEGKVKDQKTATFTVS